MSLKQWADYGWLRSHKTTAQEISNLMGIVDRTGDADYLDNCRMKRNVVEYDYVGEASDTDAEELIRFTIELRSEVVEWLDKNHATLLSR